MTDTRTPEWEQARRRVQQKRKFRGDLLAYVVFNALLVAVWALTGGGYFWPGWILAGWGAGLLISAWDVFYRRDVTEDDIRAEMRRST